MIYLNGQRRSALLAYLIEKLMALAGVDLLTLRLIPPTLTLTLTEMTAGFTFSVLDRRSSRFAESASRISGSLCRFCISSISFRSLPEEEVGTDRGADDPNHLAASEFKVRSDQNVRRATSPHGT